MRNFLEVFLKIVPRAKWMYGGRQILSLFKELLQKEIDSFYANYAKSTGITMAEAKKAVSKLDIEEYGRKAADTIVRGSFKNATFSDRIWMYQDMLKGSLVGLLSQGLIQGRNPKVLAKDLRELFGVQKYQAERLMRTEMARVQIEAQKQSFVAGGYEQYIFIATLDSKTCETCGELDGKVFNVKDMETALNAPPMHPNCRCSTAAYYGRELETSAEKSDNDSDIVVSSTGEKYKVTGEEGTTTVRVAGRKFTVGTGEYTVTISDAESETIARNADSGTIKSSGHVYAKTGNMSPDEYAQAVSLWNKYSEVDISGAEREYVYEELDNNLTAEEKSSAIVHRPIGNYRYTAINKGHNQYKIIQRELIDEPADITDKVLTEMFGEGWEDLLR